MEIRKLIIDKINLYNISIPHNKTKEDVVNLFLSSVKESKFTTYMATKIVRQFPSYYPKINKLAWLLKEDDIYYCSCCKKIKPLSQFNITDKGYPNGRCFECLGRNSEPKYNMSRSEEEKAQRQKEYNKQYWLKNKDKLIEKKRIQASSRSARVKKATPKWQCLLELDEFYSHRPEGCHVDHIIPLNHPLVCGLHTIDNLQYLDKYENMSKGNKFEI